ncbi:type VI secretion system lipoprotein TssJ [Photobacterium sanguinicancri]|uniref:Type VI secretion system lipoprotein TssJ n=1 Tax=Photobacterium sanguinicancri TaxID=875932 RepID=A0AAW7Y224_9GAMM|nr:type VI secretion system lipoprotein TssJ [Photobacterium sanguinicancri]MDO6541484.1 type VI secretion system lipoprotein TssJ [Photobacterium sanguinicancri]
MLNTIKLYLFSMLMMIFLNGCTVANLVVDPYATLKFDVSNKVNPDLNGRASPVVVKIYELQSKTIFESQDFFMIYDEADNIFGPDLVSKDTLSLSPGEELSFDIKMSPGSKYVGVVVAYRDLENAKWREIIEIDHKGYNTYKLIIDKLSIHVEKP